MLCSSDSREPGVAAKPRAVLGTYGGGLGVRYVAWKWLPTSSVVGMRCPHTMGTTVRARLWPVSIERKLLLACLGWCSSPWWMAVVHTCTPPDGSVWDSDDVWVMEESRARRELGKEEEDERGASSTNCHPRARSASGPGTSLRHNGIDHEVPSTMDRLIKW
jgi:hypothetical protein